MAPLVSAGAGVLIEGARGAEALSDAVEASKALKKVDSAADVGDVAKTGGKSFDAARREAFEKAGMTDPKDVKFTKQDPKTGTIVEFKGPDNAQVNYDAPHPNTPGAHHDKQHVGWKTGGKPNQKGNIPYEGPRHSSRGKTTEGELEPH